MAYEHPDDNNLKNLHKAMDYDASGRPILRVGSGGADSPTGDPGMPISIADSGNQAAFSRLRVAGAKLLGEFRSAFGTTGQFDIVTRFENGGYQVQNLPKTHVMIHVPTTSGARAIRQSRQYYPYIPGTSHLGFISFTFGAGKENLQQGVGMYDDLNGIFFRMNGTGPEMVIRKAGVDSEIIPQSAWNVDKFDGTGPSLTVLDVTKSQILVIDYQWLGVGRARVGFDIDGVIQYAHYFNHSNHVTEPYMFWPSLPVRYEIRNVGVTSSPSSMMCISLGVYSEGEEFETGFTHSISTGVTPIIVDNTVPTRGILAIKLRSRIADIPVRVLARLKAWNIISNVDIRYRVMVFLDSTAIAGSPVWTIENPVGWCEYTTNFALTSDPPAVSQILYDGYAAGNTGNNSTPSGQLLLDNRTASIHQNFDATDSMVFAIVATKMTNNASIYANMTWLEVK